MSVQYAIAFLLAQCRCWFSLFTIWLRLLLCTTTADDDDDGMFENLLDFFCVWEPEKITSRGM